MSAITVLGAGLIGGYVSRCLVEEGHQVVVVDNSQQVLEELECETLCANALDEQILDMHGVDIWVNMLPGSIGAQVRQPLLARQACVVDLAFSAQSPPASSAGGRMVHDVGIAPGLSNLWVGALASQGLIDVDIMVGGIPAEPDDGWSYMAPFSPSDVIEEYHRPARVLINGEVRSLAALDRRRLVMIPQVGELEAAVTDGLRSLLQNVKANNMMESTLRWPGHYQRFLQLGEMDQKTLDELFEQWQFDPRRKEMTIMLVECSTEQGQWRGFLNDRGGAGSSSMARTTGLVVLAAIDLALQDGIPIGVHAPEQLPQLLGLAEQRLLAAGVHIERDPLTTDKACSGLYRAS